MKAHVLAKLVGWGQLAANVFYQVWVAQGFPHTKAQWGSLLTSTVIALVAHAAASTDGTK